MLSYTGDVDEDFQCTFEVVIYIATGACATIVVEMLVLVQISYQLFDVTVTEELLPSGKSLRVNNTNRESG